MDALTTAAVITGVLTWGLAFSWIVLRISAWAAGEDW